MKNLLLFTAVVFIGCSQLLIAQNKFPLKSTTTKELLLEQYDADSTANALVLFEKGKAEIRKDERGMPHLFFDHVVKVKIFNKNALDKSIVEVPLYHSEKGGYKEELVSVQAMVINPDRSYGRLKKEDVYYEDVSENVTLAKFTIPNVQPGGVIDYHYTVKSDYFYNFQTWYFQEDIPKLHSEFHTSIPGNYHYNTTLYGPLELTHREEKIIHDCFQFRGLGRADCSGITYIMKDIPAFIEEDFMTSKVNYLSALRYELISFESFRGGTEYYARDWKTVDQEIKSNPVGKASMRVNYFEKHIPPQLLAADNDLKKAEAIYEFLKNKMFWNGKDHLHKEVDVKKAYESNKGSSTELNLVLLNSLKAAGLDAMPLLLSSRDHGIPSKNIPGITQFNALVVLLNLEERIYLLDITDKMHPFGMIRYELLNRHGRVMDFKEGGYWLTVMPPESYSQRIFQASIDILGNEARYREATTGYYALRARKEYESRGEEEYLDEKATQLEARGNFELLDYENKGLKTLEKTFTETYRLGLNRSANQEELIVNPFLIESFSSNPFKLVQRTYPVDFAHPYSIKFSIIVKTGKELTLKNKPENVEIKLPEHYGKLRYIIKEFDEHIKIDLNLDINDPLIPPVYYNELKEFFNEFVRLQNKNPITLIKRSKLITENAGK